MENIANYEQNSNRGEQIRKMYNHKQGFKTKLETYIDTKAFSEVEKREYIKKLLRDKEYSQKLLYMKANNRVIEIEVLKEMLGGGKQINEDTKSSGRNKRM